MNWRMALAISAIGVAASHAEAAPPAEAVEIMVLGTYHFASSQDVANMTIDDPRTPKRQAELDRLVEAVARFKPTAVVVELETDAPGYADPNFQKFTAETLKKTANEREQIGYRLAARAGVTRVYGIDEQPAAGEPDYFPFDKLMAHAEKTGQAEKIGAMIAEIQKLTASESERFRTMTIAQSLIETNTGPLSDHGFYYRLSAFDRGEVQPGAELQSYWFMRNAKIFSKIMQVAKPGDRIVVIYGSGHKYWFEHFAAETPGYRTVDPVPYLKRASGR